MEDLDYSLVPEEVWKKFISWYGIEESSRPISRRVVEHGLYVKHCKVEVYLVEFKLALHPDVDNIQSKKFSRADTVGEFCAPKTIMFKGRYLMDIKTHTHPCMHPCTHQPWNQITLVIKAH